MQNESIDAVITVNDTQTENVLFLFIYENVVEYLKAK